MTTSGSSAKVGVTYYYYPVASCSSSTCQLYAGFIGSPDGGATWGAPQTLAGPMSLSWIASTNQGRMVGDYMSTSFAGGTAHPIYAIAKPLDSGSFREQAATATFDVGGARATRIR